MSQLKEATINSIINIEGGYVNDENDSGGETRYGITKVVARDNGYIGDMRELPRSVAFKIYADRYWEALRLSSIEVLSERIAEELADTGVNMGVSRAATFLQRSLNVLNAKGKIFQDLTVDGALGSKTVTALRDYLRYRPHGGERVLLKMLNCLQGAFYVDLAERREKDETFIYGWFNNRIVV